ncbi:glycosyltransferase family 4 protein [Phycicoccus sp. CSK15P-2]|uniref:glycosyltransferase family 4 protein n=1 Tax=Phycicoccus sp. CSK15P-2 TaxID=2807627 RepID=UPI0019509DF1|nr:glycosyltransferase family 4 protein [Phycicoccus sp. CSK15P-2]MBM6402804.1 glycosyltransferase family 4 protein [Phycicoccus sp. CSK15P-2]
MAGWTLVKVALLSDCYPPRVGGIERQVHDLAHRLAATGHEVEVFTATAGPGGERRGARTHEADRVVVHRMAVPLPGGVPVNPLAPPEVHRRLDAGGFDVAHGHLGVVSPFATDLVRTALGAGLPVAATFHCVLDRSRVAFRLAGHVRRWAARGVALSAVSGMAATRVRDVAGDADVAVLNNGIDAAWWERDASRGRSAEGLHVDTVMRLVRRKRPLALLGALHGAGELSGAAAPLRATVAGEGPQRRTMEAYLRGRGMRGVELPGRLGREELRDLHHDADVYLTATRLEAFGIAALEARAAGLPVVALRGTGVDDIVTHGVDGLLVPDDAGLATAVAGLAADPGRLTALQDAAREAPPRQDWASAVSATVDEYRRAGA